MTMSFPEGDDGAQRGSFQRPCESCNQNHPNGLVWLWSSKKFVCPSCAIAVGYNDAIQAITKYASQPMVDSFTRAELTTLVSQLRSKLAVNLGG